MLAGTTSNASRTQGSQFVMPCSHRVWKCTVLGHAAAEQSRTCTVHLEHVRWARLVPCMHCEVEENGFRLLLSISEVIAHARKKARATAMLVA